MKVACAAVLLLSVLVLCDVAFSAPNCGSNGVQDSYYAQGCSCFSGFAPSTNDQVDCSASSGCPAHDPLDTRTQVGGYPPVLYSATFSRDKYQVVIRQPLVVGRRNSTVRIEGGANSCGYPGNIWKKTTNGLDCVDELHLTMPWSSNQMCGFKKDVRATTIAYSAVIKVVHEDLIQDNLGSFIRPVATALRVNITFISQKTVIYNLVNLSPGITTVTVSVVGNVNFDQNTGLAAVTLRTNAIWPYQVDTITMFSTPSPNTATLSADVLFDVATNCPSLVNAGCQQQYIMNINPNAGCNLGGNYIFNITVSCRAGTCGSNTYAGAYSVRVYDTDVCGVGGVDVGLSSGALVPFSDASGTTPSSSFVPNQVVYFAFTLISDAVTIDDMAVEKITASATSTSDVLYDLHPTTTAPGHSVAGRAAELSITPAVPNTSPGIPVTVWFSVKLVDAIPSFRVLPSAAATVTMSVVVNLQYRGNGITSKRSLEVRATTDPSLPSAKSSSMGLTDIYISANDVGNEPGDMLITNASSSLTPVSPLLLVMSFALLLLFRQY